MEEKIIQYYHPLLRRRAKEAKVGEETDKLIERMKEVLTEKGGVGLAAPQIGVSKRVILIDFNEEVSAFLNPELIEKSEEETTSKEGCLSLKGVWLDITRPKKVKVKALTQGGEKIEIETEEMLAVILQHEIDHLNGKLFIDRVGLFTKIKTLFSYFLKRNE